MNHPPCSVTVLPDPRRKRAVLRVDAPKNAAIEVIPPVENSRIERNASAFTLSLPDPVLWSPENPHIYDVRVTVDGAELEVPVALRRFTLEDGAFHLNQRRLKLRGASIDDPNAISNAIEEGCNAVRLPLNVLTASELRDADARGTLVFASLGETPDTLDNAAVQAIRNHPSLIAWHARFRSLTLTSVEQFIETVRRLDESRLILCEVTDDLGWPLFCRYVNPHETKLHVANIARLAVTAPMPGSVLDKAARFGSGRAPAMVDLVAPERLTGADTTLLEEAAADCMRAIRLNPNAAGYWFDGSPAAGGVYQAFRPIVQMDRVALRPREETGARVFLTPTDDAAPRLDISLQVIGPTGQVLWKKKRTIPILKSTKPVWDGTVGGSGQAGPHKFLVRIMSGGRIVGEDALPFHVVDEPAPADTHVRVLGPPAAFTILKHMNEEGEPPVFVVPPMGNTIWAYPAEELSGVLAAVQSGAIAVVVAPPADWNALAALYADCPHVAAERPSVSEVPASFHTPRHPIVENVRTQDLLTSVYQRLRPARVMTGASDDVVINAAGTDAHEIVVRAFGEGRLVFVNGSFLNSANDDVAAEMLLRNLVEFGGRRAVPGAGPVPPIQPILDAWRNKRATLRRWRVLGPFNEGARLPEPPATANAFDEQHESAYGPTHWTDWWIREDDGMTVDCRDACAVDGVPVFGSERMSAYAAYAFRTSVRTPIAFSLSSRCETRLWLNGRPVDNNEATTRDGGNVITVQCTASVGDWSFVLDYELGH